LCKIFVFIQNLTILFVLKDDYHEINEQTIKEETKTESESLTLTMTIKPDPLKQLLQCLNRSATTAQVFSISLDNLHLSYSTIMSKVRFIDSRKFLYID